MQGSLINQNKIQTAIKRIHESKLGIEESKDFGNMFLAS